MSDKRILPIIICGGKGSRLWPLSRESFPKQYLKIYSENSITFLQETINRVKNLQMFEDPIFICNEEHRFIVAEQIRKINSKANKILLEPVGRNTAPAITVSCLKALENYHDPIILVLPADHIIKDKKTFLKVVSKAVDFANKGKIVTFGISPHKPETGYGYIESKNDLNYDEINGEQIIKFINQKRFTWNSGIFLFKASVMLSQLEKNVPNIFEHCKKSLVGQNYDFEFQRLNKETFSKCENISIDKAIMEKTNLGIVFPLKAGWSDVGNWQSMWEVAEKDDNGNVINGEVIFENVKNSYLRSESRLLVGLGFEDIIAVETNDALLIAKKDHTQNVKDIVNFLESKNRIEANTHKTIFRPWGKYTSISKGENWQLKKIIVFQGQSLSLQLHNYRSEHWVVVSGIALVEIDGKEKILQENESAFVPLSTKHRLSNPGNKDLILIEVQAGNYLGEDDIVRFEDKYGRL